MARPGPEPGTKGRHGLFNPTVQSSFCRVYVLASGVFANVCAKCMSNREGPTVPGARAAAVGFFSIWPGVCTMPKCL